MYIDMSVFPVSVLNSAATKCNSKETVCPSSGTVVYPHMPILHKHHAVESPTRIFIVLHYSFFRFVRFWASGEQSSPKCVIPYL